MTSPRTALGRPLPRQVRLAGGTPLTLRLMDQGDRDAIVNFARALPSDDLLFLRIDITDPDVVEEWIRNIEAGRTVTVLAERDGQLVGYASLHYNELLWTRHMGEIRVMVAAGLRGQGLGRLLTSEIFAIAKGLALKKIVARMTPDQKGARATFERLGFRPEALLADFVLDREGKTRDLLIMTYDIAGFTNTDEGARGAP